MIARKLRKFIRKGGSNNNSNNTRRFKNNNNKRDYSKDLCYSSKKSGYYIIDCNKPLKEEIKKDKKNEFSKKDQKAYKKYHKKYKGLVADGSWSNSENNSDYKSSVCVCVWIHSLQEHVWGKGNLAFPLD